MAQLNDHVSGLDRHVKSLEESVSSLRASLAHWQEWYLEYSALREEVDKVPKDEPSSRKELARLRRDFVSELLTTKEINEIFGKNDLRVPEKIIGLLSRRIDYVEQNVASLKKALETEENRLAAATVVSNPDGGTDEETGLPITDIIEELDDHDNIVNFRLQTGGDAQRHIADALKEAGVEEFQPNSNDGGTSQTEQTVSPPGPVASLGADGKARSNGVSQSQPESEKNTEPRPSLARSTSKKTVSFAEDTKPGHESRDPPKPWAARQLEQIMQTAKEQEAIDLSSAVIPEDESADDRELRRRMLEYGMSEIGPLVAELELEEASDEDSIVFSETDEEGSDEDALGRSKGSVITGDYVQRMKELEKRLEKTSAFAADPHRKKTEMPGGGIGRISVIGQSGVRNPDVADRGKKTVKVAPRLDTAEESRQPQSKHFAASEQQKQPKIDPVRDVVERATGGFDEPDAEAQPKRVSRFKQQRAGADRLAPSPSLPRGPHQVPAELLGEHQPTPYSFPTGPEGKTLARTIVEHDVSSEPKEPGDMDDVLVYQEAAAEYHRLRNRLMQKQGGFVKQDESPIVPLDEEEGGPKRVSRFKAARLAR